MKVVSYEVLFLYIEPLFSQFIFFSIGQSSCSRLFSV
jgi:hypothetical protein